MCYVIESFSPQYFKLTWHSKINAVFYYRIAGIITPLLKTYLNHSKFFNKGINSTFILNLTTFFFHTNLFASYTRTLRYPNQRLYLNFTKSLQYWALTHNLVALKKLEKNEKYTHQPFLNFTFNYYKSIQIAGIFLKGSAFKRILFGFLQLILISRQN